MEPSSANLIFVPLLVLAAAAVTATPNAKPWHPDPEAVAESVHRSINASLARRELSAPRSCGTGNPMDDCWRCDPEWRRNRKKLARCAIGFGQDAQGGMKGRLYVVTDESDDAVNPRPGTLRYGAIQIQPLWIVFARDMNIRLREELMINSYKTIDGRGVNVHISDGPCLTIQDVSHVIIHGLHIHDCVPAGNTMVRDSPNHVGFRTICDGDGISILNSSHLWIDHCSLSHCADGLIDVIDGSTAITISNNLFTDHNEVMLLGSSDTYMRDKHMQVTIAFNHFNEGLIQRMPRCRLGYFHIVNNDYTKWGMYAIGGSASPTIYSQGNRFWAPDNPFAKQVTKHEYTTHDVWDKWNWRSVGDKMINGAYFVQSGAGAEDPMWTAKSSMGVRSSDFVPQLTADAGVLQCSFRC